MSKTLIKKLLHALAAVIVIVIVIVIVLLNYKQATAPADYQPPSTLNPQPLTLFFAGDIMLSRNVAAKIYKANDYSLPFKNVQDLIKAADISFANLESPFNNKGDHSVEGSLVFNADPQSAAGLKEAGVDIVSTANNHSFDQGKVGIEYTLGLLKENNIIPIGTGADCHDGTIIKKSGIKFGFLAYSYAAFNDGGKKPDPLVCDGNNIDQMTLNIQALKQKTDFVAVSMHMGTEYTRNPNESEKKLARAAIDAGADLLIGHHPHWIQTIENHNGKWIFYSLGNFVFDQMWSADTREGLAVIITINNNDNRPEIKKIELKPVIIEDFCCPRWANEAESEVILRKINLTSPILMDKNN